MNRLIAQFQAIFFQLDNNRQTFQLSNIPVPRKVLNDNYDIPLELDEQNQLESDSDNDLDEDDGHYILNAIPPAPKLQGTIPRNGDTNTTQLTSNKAIDTNLLDNQRTFAEGK